ncbi:DegT/DnrJ/EryC1/StrS family aminotransferase [Campylobacter concisus]|uniref:Aminotransferase, DegT/DnrJ/EryC1/StrS family n=1 Tax=Campylobacter concisus (strain 13826) TaxID=360104 RepID=A7ZF15_CAMC1|nr:DegT/DnrJ/EryC1/StrS family aminotransferase [Campylobacter concisus]EAT99355.1 aminotransferase, DegT/DnrJ/EryC1/StrS family [Campylobacter concisus 13826]
MKRNIPITKTIFDKDEELAIIEPLRSGWVVQGPNVSKFQDKFANFTNSRFAYATSNCTTALHLGLVAMGIKKGDKVIVPSFTFVASANAVEYTGAEVVFCDIDLRTFNIDETRLENLIKNDKNIKAIMPVNLFGLCANMPAIMQIAKKYNLKVIEDSACGFDGWIEDRHSGTFGDCGCFSFHPRKSISTGEGGMLITNDEKIAGLVSMLKDHGASKSDLQRHIEKGGSLLPNFDILGYNYRMTDIQGALGSCQMDKKERIMNGRRRIAKKYDDALKSEVVNNKKLSEILIPPYIPNGYKHGYQSYVCLFTDGVDLTELNKDIIDNINQKRNNLMQVLEENGIATRQGTHAVHTLGYYKVKNNFKDEDFLNSYAADRLTISLPMYADMSDEEFQYVIDHIKKALA